jgi:hypothetical protein
MIDKDGMEEPSSPWQFTRKTNLFILVLGDPGGGERCQSIGRISAKSTVQVY